MKFCGNFILFFIRQLFSVFMQNLFNVASSYCICGLKCDCIDKKKKQTEEANSISTKISNCT